jgi:DNA invertase Pin-like site-specific DNA recombinase
MWWKKSTKPIRAKAVAYYRHSAQDRQENSIPIQRDRVSKFAREHGIEIIREFADYGKSGLSTEGREDFKKIMEMIVDTSKEFEYVLVLDMSRWGRYQDIDLSAHYRALCKQYGRKVIYTDMGMRDEKDPGYHFILLAEAMRAAKYSAELSEKVFYGCKKIAEQGFRAGGMPPYGTYRLLLDEQRRPVQILKPGQRKSIQNQRVTLTPGDEKEQEVIRRIFKEFTSDKKDYQRIADGLNKENIPSPGGKKWRCETISNILINEIYIGTMVYNKTASRLQSRTIKNPKDLWVRTNDAFTPIVDKEVFQEAEQLILQEKEEYERRHSKEDMITKLKDLYQHNGFISAKQISSNKEMLNPQYYTTKFMSLDMAFQNMFPEVISKTRESVKDLLTLSTKKIEDYDDYIVLNDSFSVLIQPSVPIPHGYGGYWSFRLDPRLEVDVTLGVPLSNSNEYNILGYMAFPRIMTQDRNIRVFNSSDGPIERFGYRDLELIEDVIL